MKKELSSELGRPSPKFMLAYANGELCAFDGTTWPYLDVGTDEESRELY